MKELLSGQEALALGAAPQSAELNAGGQASHEENAGFGEARDLGPGEVEKMFGPAPTPRQRLEAQGIEFVESGEAEMGGGGDVDPVEDYFKKVGSDKIQEFIVEQQGKNYPDTSPIKLPDGTSILFGEYREVAAAIQKAQAKGARRPIEEIIREARRPAPPAPEPQPAPRPADWRDNLQKDQKDRLNEFEINVSKFDVVQLQNLLSRIKQLQALAPIDGWQGKGIREEDAASCLRVIIERIEEMSGQKEVVGDIRGIARVARITGWRPPPDEFDPEIDLSAGGTNGT